MSFIGRLWEGSGTRRGERTELVHGLVLVVVECMRRDALVEHLVHSGDGEDGGRVVEEVAQLRVEEVPMRGMLSATPCTDVHNVRAQRGGLDSRVTTVGARGVCCCRADYRVDWPFCARVRRGGFPVIEIRLPEPALLLVQFPQLHIFALPLLSRSWTGGESKTRRTSYAERCRRSPTIVRIRGSSSAYSCASVSGLMNWMSGSPESAQSLSKSCASSATKILCCIMQCVRGTGEYFWQTRGR